MLLEMSNIFGLIGPFIRTVGSSILPCLVPTKVAFASFWTGRMSDESLIELMKDSVQVCFVRNFETQLLLALLFV